MTIQVQGYTQKFIQARGLRFSYLEWGQADAPTMVLLHGLTSFAHAWDVFADAFQNEYHIFVLDQRGHGDTEWPKPPSYHGADYVEDLAEPVKSWYIDRFVLIGHSMGAHNALAFASRSPDKVIKLVAVDHPPEVAPPFKDGGVARTRATAAAEIVFNSTDEIRVRARELNPIASDDMLHYLAQHRGRQIPDGRWMHKYSPDATSLWYPEDLWARLGQITCPTFVIRRSESALFFESDIAEKESAAILSGRLVTIAGAGHPVPIDKPVEFEAAVRAFLRD